MGSAVTYLMSLAVLMTLTISTSVESKESALAGVTGDGVHNDSPGIQKALDAAGVKGGVVTLGPGRFRLESGLKIPEGVTLQGTWQAPHHAKGGKGTILLGLAGKGLETGPALIYLMANSTIKGVTIYYPDQRLPEAVAFPWTIQGEGMHGSVVDVTLVNSYKGIDFGAKPNELHYIRNVFGCPLKIGVHIDQCTDIGRIENVHFNPHYWARSDEANIPEWKDLSAYLFANLVAFSFGRSDWEYVHNTFSYGAKVGYRFYESPAGACNGNFLGLGSDWAETSVLVEQTQAPGLLITNGEFVSGAGSKAMIDVTAKHSGVVQMSNCAFWGPSEVNVRTAGTGLTSLNQCNFVQWDTSKTGNACVLALGGDVSIAQCNFRAPLKDIVLEKDIDTAVIMGNTFREKMDIQNNSKGDVQMTANVVKKK